MNFTNLFFCQTTSILRLTSHDASTALCRALIFFSISFLTKVALLLPFFPICLYFTALFSWAELFVLGD
jgi:hypothetical protein